MCRFYNVFIFQSGSRDFTQFSSFVKLLYIKKETTVSILSKFSSLTL